MVAVSHRRLYLTMLGVCGQPSDVADVGNAVAVRRSEIQDGPRRHRGLLPDAEARRRPAARSKNLFLKKKQEEFTDIFSVVMALRFLGQEEHGPIPRERLIGSMRLVLDHPRLADQAIMDLARWKDWSVMDRLVDLFTSADPETTTWVRIPVINYLRACPLPKAKQYIEELRKIDPEGGAAIGNAVCRRARSDAERNDPTGRFGSGRGLRRDSSSARRPPADGVRSKLRRLQSQPSAEHPRRTQINARASGRRNSILARPSSRPANAADRPELIVALARQSEPSCLVAVNRSGRGKSRGCTVRRTSNAANESNQVQTSKAAEQIPSAELRNRNPTTRYEHRHSSGPAIGCRSCKSTWRMKASINTVRSVPAPWWRSCWGCCRCWR